MEPELWGAERGVAYECECVSERESLWKGGSVCVWEWERGRVRERVRDRLRMRETVRVSEKINHAKVLLQIKSRINYTNQRQIKINCKIDRKHIWIIPYWQLIFGHLQIWLSVLDSLHFCLHVLCIEMLHHPAVWRQRQLHIYHVKKMKKKEVRKLWQGL